MKLDLDPSVLEVEPAMNALSRYGHGYVCHDCGIAEALCGIIGWDAKDSTFFEMARRGVYQDRQEALRLPAGSTWGCYLALATGGLERWNRLLIRVKPDRFLD